ncbi:protein kinase domain-containing protein, partial [Acidisphaera rubrifaciens]|uniref:protein kinase domain-containing protein n=1 Tax=Acidisphaera rubrifaciens TaxID=50715 RepID=UPI00066298F7
MAAERGGSPTLNDAYAVDFARALDGWGEATAYPATARAMPGVPLLAILVPPGRAPRARVLTEVSGLALPGVLMPLAHGPLGLPDGRAAWAVVTDAPPGPSLAAAPRAWTEADLLRHVVIPVGATLARLHAGGVHHRGIRPDNLFAAPGQPCVLGPAWTEPPASRQPAVCEPPYSAMCLPCGRGEGTPGDDVYALGVTLIALVAGRLPLDGLDDAAVIRRKLDLGSFAALTGDVRLSPPIADLLRGMLADDPDHRPAAALLADPAALRARRAYVRP